MTREQFIFVAVLVGGAVYFSSRQMESNPWRDGEELLPEHVERARFFVDFQNGKRREVEVIEYEPHYYSVWEIFIGPYNDRYIGTLYEDGGLWKAQRPGEYRWALFGSKRQAAEELVK